MKKQMTSQQATKITEKYFLPNIGQWRIYVTALITEGDYMRRRRKTQ